MQNTVSNNNNPPSFLKASSSRPNMGLNNKICINPKYWCRLHEVWLSEGDVIKKNCKNRPTFDLIGTYRCGCLEERNIGNGYK